MTSDELDILREFLEFPLTNTDAIMQRFANEPNAIYRANPNNRLQSFVYIPGTRSNKVVLLAHADTKWDEHYRGNEKLEEWAPKERIHYDPKTSTFRSRHPEMGLGADDRAGCAMCWILRSLGHSILITGSEEHGQIAANWLMTDPQNQDIADELNHAHQFMIQLDRRNQTDYKVYSVGTEEFCDFIEKETHYQKQEESTTDIVTLCRHICGVNFSIGYHNEHTAEETLNVNAWSHTLNVCRALLVKEMLPQFRLY